MTLRPRPLAATVLAAVGTVALFVGTIYAWAAPTLFDSAKFAARARASLEASPALREVVARELVVNVVERSRSDLIAFRPVLVSAAETVVATGAFADVFETAVRSAHELSVDDDTTNAVVRANDALLLLLETLRIVAPDVADQIPADLEPALLRFRDASLQLDVWRGAERAELLAWVLPVVGALAWAGAFLVAPDRRRVLVQLGVVLTVGGVLLLAGLRIGERVVAGRFDVPLDERAARDVYEVYVDGLRALAWLGIAGGIVLAAAVQAITREESRLAPARLRAALTDLVRGSDRPRWVRVAVAAGAGVLGVLMVLSPLGVLETGITLAGAFLFYTAVVTVLGLLVGSDAPAAPAGAAPGWAPAKGRAWAIGVAASLGVVLVVGAVVYLVVSSPESVQRVPGCNGRIELCVRRLDDVALPTTHNAPTAAEDGFLLPNQDRGMGAQLRDGVRGFQIDAYLGSVRRDGGVRVVFTDLDDGKLLTIEDTVGPELTAQALEFRRIVGPPDDDARQDVYLCHNFCELGAVRMRDEMERLRRFLDRNPGEVVMIVVQDELPAERLLPVLAEAGLDRYLATIDWSRPLPTLGALVSSGERLVLGLENGDLGPRIPNVFREPVVQEVPYDYRTLAELVAPDSCRPLRGRPDAPLFQFNHWVTPASLSASREANTAAVLGERAERCRTERGLQPNLVAVDFYRSGDLFAVVDALNDSHVPDREPPGRRVTGDE